VAEGGLIRPSPESAILARMRQISGDWEQSPQLGKPIPIALGSQLQIHSIIWVANTLGRHIVSMCLSIFAFHGGADGNVLNSDLAMDAAGVLYGTTWFGGDAGCTYGCGLVFKITP
jgi:hypothetical protein